MIQRKQSLWLLLAALFNAGVLYFDLYRVTSNGNHEVIYRLRVPNDAFSMLLMLFIVMLPLVSIFMFKDRKRQSLMAYAGMGMVVAFIANMLRNVSNLTGFPAMSEGNFWIGSVLPVFGLFFIILAVMGIRHDERLVKSMDRLR
jgi:hypothetical protein